MTEKQIILDLGSHWVGDNKTDYTVYVTGLTHSTSDSSYPHTPDGLSIAIARCKYLNSKNEKMEQQIVSNLNSNVKEEHMRATYVQAFGKEFDAPDRKQEPLPLEMAYEIAMKHLMRTQKIYVMEVYRYNTDQKANCTLHVGRLDENRDSLTPVMMYTSEFFAKNKKEAEKKVRLVAKALKYKFVKQ